MIKEIIIKAFQNELILPIWYAIFCGSLIGLERELKNKDAGIKTSIFICVGAAIFTYLGSRIDGVNDNSRVIAQIVSGIGFIGGGVIIYEKDKVQGLTSAVIIWVTAAIGILSGMGMYYEAVMSTLTIVISDKLIDMLKQRLIGRSKSKEDSDE